MRYFNNHPDRMAQSAVPAKLSQPAQPSYNHLDRYIQLKNIALKLLKPNSLVAEYPFTRKLTTLVL